MFWIIFLISIFAVLALWILIRCIYIPKFAPHTLFFSGPGSGKTMFLTRYCIQLCKKGCFTFSNYALGGGSHGARKHQKFSLHEVRNQRTATRKSVHTPVGSCTQPMRFDKSMLGTYRFPPGSVLFFDEASLNGYDNRDFKDNFKNNKSLEYFKLIRHYQNSMVWSNQGWDELDKKIRTLCTQYWLVTKLPLFSVAVRYFVRVRPREGDDEFHDHYKPASPLRLIFDPNVVQLVYRPYWGKFYDSWSTPDLPDAPLVPWS